MITKTWTLTINRQPFLLTLTPPSSWGYCFKCRLEKEIWIVSEKQLPPTYEEKKFCWSCVLANLYELERGNYQVKQKKEIIKQLREALWAGKISDSQEKEELLECYG